MQMTQGVEHRDGAERAAADAQHDEIFELSAHFFGGGEDIFHDLFLVIGKFRPAHHALAAALRDAIERVRRRFFEFVYLGIFKSVGADEFFHHIVVVHRDAHAVAPIFVPVIHKNLRF